MPDQLSRALDGHTSPRENSPPLIGATLRAGGSTIRSYQTKSTNAGGQASPALGRAKTRCRAALQAARRGHPGWTENQEDRAVRHWSINIAWPGRTLGLRLVGPAQAG